MSDNARLLADTTAALISEWESTVFSPQEIDARVRAVNGSASDARMLDSHRRYLATILSLDSQLRAALADVQGLRVAQNLAEKRAAQFESFISGLRDFEQSSKAEVKTGRYKHCQKHRRVGYGECPSCLAEGNEDEASASTLATDSNELPEIGITDKMRNAAATLGRIGGKIGGHARAAKLSKARRSEIAKKAATTRWGR